ncbi:MAG: HK97 gp10 family phage protein [Lachnospiraceae bacterium]|nr:HK97 gp10 family phage protein [Lachnospiraceae bacterium]
MKTSRQAALKALEAVGIQCQSHAVKNIKSARRVDTGRLAGSITHIVEPYEPAVYVGTNVEYAIYNEVGTGIFAEGSGRETPWRYVDDEGVWHWTRGMKPIHFLRDAVDDHKEEYTNIIKEQLKSG